jgi:hypothetical protein
MLFVTIAGIGGCGLSQLDSEYGKGDARVSDVRSEPLVLPPMDSGARDATVGRESGGQQDSSIGDDADTGNVVPPDASTDGSPPDASLPDGDTGSVMQTDSEPPFEAGMDVAMPPEASTDGATPSEASTDSCPMIEDCQNGVDDNCDGLVDCADPQCQALGWACTQGVVPTGWSLVAFSATARPFCPTAYPTTQNVVSNVAGAADSCTCDCKTLTSASCQGTVVVEGWPNACAMGAADTTLAVNDGACGSTSIALKPGNFYSVDQLAGSISAQQGTCSATGEVAAMPAPTFSSGITCGTPTVYGTGGCTQGETCAPSVPNTLELCMMKAGAATCPPNGFSAQTNVSTGTPGYVDGRSCGGCACGTNLSCGSIQASNVNVELYSSSSCGTGIYNVPEACASGAPTATATGYKVAGYGTSGSAACDVTTASAPTGSVTLDPSTAATICCP